MNLGGRIYGKEGKLYYSQFFVLLFFRTSPLDGGKSPNDKLIHGRTIMKYGFFPDPSKIILYSE